jgi:hypothetical protein
MIGGRKATYVVRTIVLAMTILLVGCTIVDQRPDNPDRSKLGVLVIAGEGLNSRYDDLRASSAMFMVSQKFAEAIHSEIQKRGTKAQLYLNRDRNGATTTYVSKLLASKEHDGLVQVTVSHIKNGTENTIYLTANYSPLQWRRDATSERIVTGTGPVKKWNVLSVGSDLRYTPYAVFAQEFVETLHKFGFIE